MMDRLTEKQSQFNAAMAAYETRPIYKRVGRAVSWTNVSLQIVLALLAFHHPIGPLAHALTFAAAYVLADLINGLVHLYMDNNDDYTSPVGPLVAAFHLHHRTPRYARNPLIVVYWHESGAKVWLAFFLILAVAAVGSGAVSGAAAYGLLYVAVLSSVAEVSHYLCHVPPQAKAAGVLARAGILLSSRHHARHHTDDNVSYAFLNAMTDPLINGIAKALYPGYKTTTDLHYARYTGADTENRRP